MNSIEDKEDNEKIAGRSDSDDSLDNVLYDHEEEEQSQSESREPLTEEEIEQLIAELLEVESKAAEAQEALEDESLVKVEADVRQELTRSLTDDELEKAVVEEMTAFKEEWETELDELETESVYLLEQLDGAGIDLSSLYKWIERQAPNGCSTEAWKKRTHWVGTKMSLEATESVAQADEYLHVHRPVRRRHGKILEEGASGFLGKKIEMCESTVAIKGSFDADWDTFSTMCSKGTSMEDIKFGSKHWASVYLASTPQQAAELGLKFPGVNEVEEIDDVDGVSNDPFVGAYIANERDLSLTEEQKRNFRKVKEEDDANDDLKLHICMKQRFRKRCKQVELSSTNGQEQSQLSMVDEDGTPEDNSGHPGSSASASPDLIESRAFKHLILVDSDNEPDELKSEDMRCSVINIDSDNETPVAGNRYLQAEELYKSEVHMVSSSDSGSGDSDGDVTVKASTKRRQKKKIRRIIDDAELGEETKKKVAIEKERQERLKSLEARFSLKSMMNPLVSDEISFDGAGVEVLGDTSLGYIINLVREEDEEVVRIPPSISMKLKLHQIGGIRFMWENIIQSIKNVRSGDKGLGCILAHTMGLGKTFQVIAFLYTALRSVDLGLKAALIVTPISVLHNWRHEFIKWRPSELEPLCIFMLEDVPREKRVELLMKWRSKGGVLLIGYTTFRNLSLGKYVKDRDVAKEISHALQVAPDILVCDEAHIIKNTKADITHALKQVKCQRRIALTGSPLQNNLMEYYCMVDFVREGFLGSSHEFKNRFQNPIENGQHTNSTAEDVKLMNQRSHILHEQLKGFVQRMDSNTVKKDLPPKTVFVISVKLSPLQRKLYRRFLNIHGFTKDKSSGEKRSFFAGYQALAQIWNHPGILQLIKGNKDSGKYEDVENRLADGSSCDENGDRNVIPHVDWWRDLLQENNCKEIDYGGKMVLLLDILTMCSDMGDKALVFSQSLWTLDLIEFYLSKLPRPRKNGKYWKKGRDWYRLDGKTESSERQKLVERFNEPSNTRVKCTLISTRAGSLGINLYAANRVIIVDGSWNPTFDLQAIYRVWRYGQTKPVFAYRLMAHGTMEEKIYKRQVTKEGLAARVVDRQQVHRTMSKEEILHLFDFGDDENAEIMPELGQGQEVGNLSKQELPHQHAASDKLMQTLISRHHPSWISNYHEHETLLQENEGDRLSKEEQDLAWDLYRKTINWEQGRRVSPQESILKQEKIFADASALKQQQILVAESADDQKPVLSAVDSPASNASSRVMDGLRNHFVVKNCTNLSHLLTLRSQGTKMGCSTICIECDQEIRWEDLNRDGSLVK